MRLVILGPPGAGKGTQAVLLCNSKGLAHISTGEMLRAAMESGSELGQKVKEVVESGVLVSDDLMIELIKDRIQQDDCATGFLLDGFPRTVAQAEALDALLTELSLDLTAVLELVVPENVLFERIRKRGESSGRADDDDEVAAKRLQVYWEQTAPVSKYYRKNGEVVEIEGLGTIEEVQERLQAAVSS